MLKRFILVLLALVLAAGVLPVGVLAASDGPAEPGEFRNSDSEAAWNGVCWYVDTLGKGCLKASRMEEGALTGDAALEIEPVTDWPVDQVLYWQGRLMVSAGERLLTLDPDTGAILETRRFEAPVDRFAVSSDGIYVLAGGLLRRLGDRETVLARGVTRFWLETADQISFLQDETTVQTLTLSTGQVTQSRNRVSTLADAGTRSPGLQAMKRKFPEGKYWNHMPDRGTGMTYNNQDGWTDLPCPKHNGYCGTSMQTCNGYAPEGKELSYQCWGYADKLGHDVSGRDPQSTDQGWGWKKLWTTSSLNTLKAGDIIRYNRHGDSRYAHSIYVTAVNGDTITYTDCNYDGTCVIRWDEEISLSTVRSWFVFLLSAPEEAQSGNAYTLNVDACLDGEAADNTADWAVFDVYLEGEPVALGVTEFCETLQEGTAYELRNVEPREGVCLDPETVLTGTLRAGTALVLTLDHYYLNSAGEPVKTTLADLPRQDHWSYPAICWALETGVASGVSATAFAPEQVCTRAQTVTFLWAAAGRPEPEIEGLTFEDVEETDYFCTAVRWAVEQGITAGKSETCFAPQDQCTRAEVVTFLWASAGRPQLQEEAPEEEPEEPTEEPEEEEAAEALGFADVKETDYFYNAVLWAVEQGVTAGKSEDCFAPKDVCTRAQIVTFLRAFYT